MFISISNRRRSRACPSVAEDDDALCARLPGIPSEEVSLLDPPPPPAPSPEKRNKNKKKGTGTAVLRPILRRSKCQILLRKLAPQAGFEPATLRLTAGCSAVELLRNGR